MAVPQRSRGTQKLAIESLTGYAAVAHAFVIVAPPLAIDGMARDVATYNRRMWCRAENLAFSLRNGVAQMWVATGPTMAECMPQSNDAEFMRSNLRVFQGEATDERDKLSLVVPILGLYAELYATALHLYAHGEVEALGDVLLRKPEREQPRQPHQTGLEALSGTMDAGDKQQQQQQVGQQQQQQQVGQQQQQQVGQELRGSSLRTANTQGSDRSLVSFADVAEQAVTLEKQSAETRGLRGLLSLAGMAHKIKNYGSHSHSHNSNSSRSSFSKISIFSSNSANAAHVEKSVLPHTSSRRGSLSRSDTTLLVSHGKLQVLRLILGDGTSAERERLAEELFPREITITPPPGAERGESQSVELFGPLIRMMQERLHADVELREKLVAQAKRHKKVPTIQEIECAMRCAQHWRKWSHQRSLERAELQGTVGAATVVVEVV